jgi:hypothetical protein
VRKHHAATQAEISPTDQGITQFYASEQYGFVPPQQPIAVIGSGWMKKKLGQLVSLFDGKASDETMTAAWNGCTEPEKLTVCTDLCKRFTEGLYAMEIDKTQGITDSYLKGKKRAGHFLAPSAGKLKKFETFVTMDCRNSAKGSEEWFLWQGPLKQVSELTKGVAMAQRHIKEYKSPTLGMIAAGESPQDSELTVDNLRQELEKIEKENAAAKQAFAEHQKNKTKTNTTRRWTIRERRIWIIHNPKFFLN